MDYFKNDTSSISEGKCLAFVDPDTILIYKEMKRSLKILIIIVNILLLQISGVAQTAQEKDLLNIEIVTVLPPLGHLIDSAIAHNPYVRYRDLQIIVNKCKYNADRSQWLRNMGVQTDIRHGTFDNFSTNTSEGQNPSLFATKSNQTNYGVGAYIKFPLYDLVNRKNQVNLAKTEVEQAESMAEVQRDEVRQLVIRQYQELILNQKLIRNKSKYFETAKVSMAMAEKEFQNGVIPVGEYSRISEIANRAADDFETARINFITSYLILEEIVGIKFNLKNLEP